ncbi:hypothetical protein BHE74_00056138, partial [Ensete ventricosum]
MDCRRPKSMFDGRFLPQSAADGRNRPPTVDFWQNRPVVGGPRTDNLTDQYVPLVRVPSPRLDHIGLKKREKKHLESALLFARIIRSPWVKNHSCDPSPVGDFFSLRGEKKCLPTWGEGTRR